MITLTKTLLRERLGHAGAPASDAAIARFFGISQSAVNQWGDADAAIPVSRAMQAALTRPDLFGSLSETAANDDIGPGREEDGDGVTDTGVDVESTQGAESKVHRPASSAQPTAGATMIGGDNPGGAR